MMTYPKRGLTRGEIWNNPDIGGDKERIYFRESGPDRLLYSDNRGNSWHIYPALLPGLRHIGFYADKQKRVIDCRACGFKHLYPIPAGTEQYYRDDQFYTSHSPPDWFEKEKREYEAGLWGSYYRHLANCLNRDKPIIDVGCGAGWLVDFLNIFDYNAIGVEPSSQAREVAYKGNRLLASLDDVDIKGHVILSLVLEHIAAPAQFLREDILPILDGRLIVVVPNDFSLIQRYIGGDWFVSPVHINYFSPKSLRALLERVGLKIVYEGATYPMELNILLGRDYRGNDELGRKIHNQRLAFETRWGPKVFHLYRLLYRLFGIGRELIMVAEK